MIHAIIDHLSDAAIGIDKEGKVALFNEPAKSLFFAESGNPMGKKIWDAMEINDFTRAFVSLVKDSEPSPLEQILPFPNNRVFLVKMIPVRGSDDRVVGAVAILEDLTEIQRIELTMNEFVAMVSHELRIPLTSIKGFVETLLEGAYSNPEVTRKFLQVINEETNRMTRLVISLLDLTRIVRKDGEAEEFQPINTSLFISSAVKLFEPLAQEKKIALTWDVPENLPTIHVNTDKLRQVIINLVDNAIKYTGLKVFGGSVKVAACADGGAVRVDVVDSGIGIAPDEQEKIFEKFYRVTQGPAAQLGGTGLGLSITREIVNAHGGKITVASIPGEGSTFSFTIPIR